MGATPYLTGALAHYARSDLGSPIPVNRKSPLVAGFTGYEGHYLTQRDIAQLAAKHPTANLGLRLRDIVIGIDVDHYGDKHGADQLADLERELGPLPNGPYSTSRGPDQPARIRFFRVPPGRRRWLAKLARDIEVIHYGLRYAVVWPSIHPDGEGRVYRWYAADGTELDGPPELADLPELPAAWVEHMTCPDVGHTPDGAEIEPKFEVGKDGTERGLRVLSDEISRVWPTERDERGWNNQLFVSAKRIYELVAGGELADEPTRLRLIEMALTAGMYAEKGAYEQRNRIEATVESGRRRGLERARQLKDPTEQEEIEKLARQFWVQEQARELVRQRRATSALRLPDAGGTLAERLARPRPVEVWAIDELQPLGTNAVVTAQFGTGKTTLGLNVAWSLSGGLPFLGKFKAHLPEGRRVGFLNCEMTGDMFDDWCRDLGFDRPDLLVPMDLRGYSVPITTDAGRAYIANWLRDNAIWYLVVDSWARMLQMCGGGENDNDAAGALTRAFDVLKREGGTPNLLLLAHTGRQQFEEGQERARGATALDDWADVRWVYTKNKERDRFIFADKRVTVPEQKVTFDEATRLLTINGGSRKEENQTTRDENARFQVLNFLRSAGAPKGIKAIRAGVTGVGSTAIDLAVDGLLEDDVIEVDETATRGRPYRIKPKQGELL